MLLAIFSTSVLSAQVTGQIEAQDSSDSKPIIVDIADAAEYISADGEVIKLLMRDIRQVELRQGNTFMYCDTAKIIGNEVVAYGNIIIQQGDSINVFADSLVYDGETEIADLFGNVVLEKDSQQLFTNQLNYNLQNEVATYHTGALLTNGGAQLRSKKGSYFINRDIAFFSDEVVIVDSSFTLQSDTLEFNTKTEVATFHGPTLIQQDSSKIYCEAGFYDMPNKIAEFRENAQYLKEDQIATAEIINYDGQLEEVLLRGDAKFKDKDKNATANIIRYDLGKDIIFLEGDAVYKDDGQEITAEIIEYDSKNEAFKTNGRSFIEDGSQLLQADTVDYDASTGFAIAMGNVIWEDTLEQTTIYAEQTRYNKDTDFLVATGGRPMMRTISGGDTLFIAADTLQSFESITVDSISVDSIVIDSSRNFLGYTDVRIFKADLQGLSDTINFIGKDSIFVLKGNPILWSDSSQFIADTIKIFLDSGRIDRIKFDKNALIVNTKDELFFNQIQGREMVAFFENDQIARMSVNGNAESVYYAQDDSTGYFGVNKSLSNKMMLYFGDGELNSINAYKDPVSNVFPMREADHEGLKLKGFKWAWDTRPKTIEDLRKPKIGIPSVNQPINSSSLQSDSEVPTPELPSRESKQKDLLINEQN